MDQMLSGSGLCHTALSQTSLQEKRKQKKQELKLPLKRKDGSYIHRVLSQPPYYQPSLMFRYIHQPVSRDLQNLTSSHLSRFYSLRSFNLQSPSSPSQEETITTVQQHLLLTNFTKSVENPQNDFSPLFTAMTTHLSPLGSLSTGL